MGTIDFNLDDNKMNVDGTSPSSSPGSLSSSSSLSTATTGSTVILPSTPTPAATPLKTASPLPPSEHKPSSSSSAPPRPPARPRATSHATHLAHETPRRPSRRNKRDSVAPQDSTLLGLSQDTPLVPAGGYIIYVTNTLDKTTFDKDRVPPSTYGAIAPPTSSSPSLPPLKHFVHIEVPIFKPCSIAQFHQDEKKRKMEILSKALAKEEAKAAAEALALAASHEPVAPPAPGARTVSTRLKHKEAASHQQVSVVTATPGAHGKKSTTVVTTGAGSGTAAGSHHKRLDEEDLHDEVYEKRHRKQEMLERRIKNREKEKLRHAMYQQQQVVEKLRHMDINRLMPLSAFRTQTHKKTTLEEPPSSSVSVSQSQDDGHGAGSSQISVAAAKIMQEEYHRRLIREAEESLSRFEQLGLSGETSTSLTDYSPFSRTKNRLLSLEIEPVSSSEPEESESEDEDEDEDEDQETAKHYLSDEPTPKVVQRKRTRVVSGEEEGGRRRARKSTPSTTISSTPSSRKPKAASTPVEPPRPPKPITTFIKPGSILASGGRKSSRVALAFGEKVPILDRMDFDLPMDDVFGPLLRARLSARGETVPGTDKDKDKGKGKVTKGRIHVQATVSTSISAKENKDIDPEESSISSTLSSEISLSSDASSLVE
ncbi:hypothetical protein BG005_005284 [Podila minutissima]|nr:hypothetical protein BG005_005284 [Podila minutissima]